MNFSPIATTEAGACLTHANWQEIGIKSLGFSLDALLMKPGLAFLEKISDLQGYYGWRGKILVNASLAEPDREGIYTIRSRYDGSLLRIDSEAVFALLLKLRPNQLLLPQGLATYKPWDWQPLDKTTAIFIPERDYSQGFEEAGFGLYLSYDNKRSFTACIEKAKAAKTCFMSGDFELEQLAELKKAGVRAIESNKAASDALAGRIYSVAGTINLLSAEMAQDYQLIDEACACPTCTRQFTKAYLHHLLLQTPLLCQRFLIQHNVYFYQNSMASI